MFSPSTRASHTAHPSSSSGYLTEKIGIKFSGSPRACWGLAELALPQCPLLQVPSSGQKWIKLHFIS